jgi:hypothetical protein
MAFNFSSPKWSRANFATPPGPDMKALGFGPPPGLAPNSLNCGCAQSADHSGPLGFSALRLNRPPCISHSRNFTPARARGGIQTCRRFGIGPMCAVWCFANTVFVSPWRVSAAHSFRMMMESLRQYNQLASNCVIHTLSVSWKVA